MRRPAFLRRPDVLRRHPHTETLVVLAFLGGLAGGAVIALGLYNVSAAVPHLPPTRWALHTTYENAVRLRAPAEHEVPPDLLTDARAELGARHFDAACRQCHAAPGELQQATVRRMRPEPPHVTEAVEGWEPRHLHWILDQGVKMSGMPSWPADRPEEVWSTVGFLERVRDMDAAGYARLTVPPEAVPAGPHAATLGYCAGCHGLDGMGRLRPHVPRLDILGEEYVALALASYRDGERESGYMRHAASEPTPAALDAVARYFGSLPAGEAGPEPDPELAERGRVLAEEGTLDDPACTACHGPPMPARAAFPNLSGQWEGYLATQLRLWRDGDRGGTHWSELMHKAATELSDEEIAALAAYFASLPPSVPGDTAAAVRP